MTLTEFLLARIAEDEVVARDAEINGPDTVEHEHEVRWQPTRVLAECEAKRRIVELYSPEGAFLVRRGYLGFRGSETLRLLALPYADHRDFKQEWAL